MRDRVISNSGCTVYRPNSQVQVIPCRARPSLSDLNDLLESYIQQRDSQPPFMLQFCIGTWYLLKREQCL